MHKRETKVKNILSFLAILFGEDDIWWTVIMEKHPDYLIEKFERYILSDRSEWQWGMHPSLKRSVFDQYCQKYELGYGEDSDE